MEFLHKFARATSFAVVGSLTCANLQHTVPRFSVSSDRRTKHTEPTAARLDRHDALRPVNRREGSYQSEPKQGMEAGMRNDVEDSLLHLGLSSTTASSSGMSRPSLPFDVFRPALSRSASAPFAFDGSCRMVLDRVLWRNNFSPQTCYTIVMSYTHACDQPVTLSFATNRQQ